MKSLIFLEIKSALRQYKESLNIKKAEYLIYFIFLLLVTMFFKALNIFQIKIEYIMLFIFVAVLFMVFINNTEKLIEEFKTKKYKYTKMYPVKNVFSIFLKTIEYGITLYIELLIFLIIAVIMLTIAGYNFIILIKYFNIIMFSFLILNNLFSIFKIIKNKYINNLSRILFETVKIGGQYISLYLFMIIGIEVSKNMESENFSENFNEILNFNSKVNFENYLNKLNSLFVILFMIFLALILFFIKIKLIELAINIDNFKKDKKNRFENIFNFKDIFIKKEMHNLINENGIRDIFNKLIAYIIFSFMYIIFNTIFNIELKINMNGFAILLIATMEIINSCTKISSANFTNEKSFVIHYLFSGYSVLKILIKRSIIYTVIVSIYIFFIELLLSIIFKIEILEFISIFFSSIVIIFVILIMENIFSTYKMKYKSKLGNSNLKLVIKKHLNTLGYAYLMVISNAISMNIENQNYKFISQFIIILLVSSIYLLILLLFMKKRESEFYGEYKNAFSKK